jgi:hypothetical protein
MIGEYSMNKRIRQATGDKVEIIDKESPYFGKTVTLIEPRPVPVRMKLEYHWLVKLDGTETTEVFTPRQLRKIEGK